MWGNCIKESATRYCPLVLPPGNHQFALLQENELEIEDEVNLLMSTDILAAQISTKRISFARAQSGWIFREDKKVNAFSRGG